MSRSRWLLAALALALALPCAADEEAASGDGALLRYRFDRLAGRVATYTIESEQRVRQEVVQRSGERGGGEVKTWARETQRQTYSADGEDRGEVALATDRIEARIESPSQHERYDSADPEAEPTPRLDPWLRKLGRTVTLQVTPRGRVTRVRGCEPTERAAYQASFLELPPRPLVLGRGWDRLDEQPMPPLGTLQFHFKYRLRERVPAADGQPERYRIEATIHVEYRGVGPTQHAHVEVTHQQGSGHLILDADGLLLESVLDSELEITIKSTAGTQVQRIESRTIQRLRDVRAAEGD